MENLILIISSVVILIPVFLFVLSRKMFYYSLILLYPIVGQLISQEFVIFGISINPSMVFGLLAVSMTAIDFLFHPSQNLTLEIAVVLFILYSIFISAFSPIRFASLSWALKIATWLLILLASIKLFKEERDLYQIHLVVAIGVLVVIFSFFLSRWGFYGQSFTYKTGVESYGAGFSSGKTLAYYLTISIPVLALRISEKASLGRWLSLVLIIISIIVIVLTFVRAPVVAILIGFLAYNYFSYKYGNKSFLMRFSIIIATILIIFLAFTLLQESQYTSRWSEIGDKYTKGKVEKIGSGRVGGLMRFFEYYLYKAPVINKIFGSGLGSSTVYLGHNKIIHNDFAEILMGCGIIGFSLYMFIILKIYWLLTDLLKITHPIHYARYGILAMSNLFIFLSFHMTNVSSGVLILSVWALFSGASIGLGQSVSETRNRKWNELLEMKRYNQLDNQI
ncbi:MAG: hypothetical protein PVI06_19890 [Desulfobacterales bacterium]|jgi:hypothetical protein